MVSKEGGGGKGRGFSDVVLDTSMAMRLAAREATLASVIPARKRGARNSRMSLWERRFQAPADILPMWWSRPRYDCSAMPVLV